MSRIRLTAASPKQTGASGPSARTPKQRARPRIIAGEEDVRAGIKALHRKCEIVRLMHAAAGDPPLRRRNGGFEGLARIIVGQQLSVASSEAIWNRLAALVEPFEPERMGGLSDEALRGAGLSNGKVRTLRALIEAIAGGLDLERLDELDDEAVREALTQVSGIGPWTSDIYIMFCLGRADGFPPGDLALQVAAQTAMRLDARPTERELLAIAERWRPWRGVAARLLWAYYRVVKSANSGVPV